MSRLRRSGVRRLVVVLQALLFPEVCVAGCISRAMHLFVGCLKLKLSRSNGR